MIEKSTQVHGTGRDHEHQDRRLWHCTSSLSRPQSELEFLFGTEQWVQFKKPLTFRTLQHVERSCFLKTESIQVQNLAGTPEFMAPEVVNFEDISTGSGSS